MYANRFRGRGKTLYTVCNATGFTFAGPVLELDVGRDEHVFDLTRSREADLRPADGRPARVHLFLPRDGVACLAVLPKVLEIGREDEAIVVRAKEGARAGEVRLCDATGKPLAVRSAAETVRFEPGTWPKDAAPACIKLMADGRLVDASAVP